LKKEKVTAILLAAGQGKRMNSSVQKQYLSINNQPIMVYALRALEKCQDIDEIIIVVGLGEYEFCENEILKKYPITKPFQIIEGGKERYHSVYNALQKVQENNDGYVLIHDAARPLITKGLLEKCIKETKKSKACTLGVPVKDTIKIVDTQYYIKDTPNRNTLWSIQTPQGFQIKLLKQAYDLFMKSENNLVTDDAMIIETYTPNIKVKVVMGDYKNLKVTTPEDLSLIEALLKVNV
jgi:2-C-methyl-D-erythritol 4-phosphate cytidylyltransferase